MNEAVKETTIPKKGHKGGANEHIPTGTRNTQGKYIVKDWAGNEKDYFGSYDSTGEAYEQIAEWLRSKGIDEVDLDLELGEYDVVPRKK